jgi:hypothetical protein
VSRRPQPNPWDPRAWSTHSAKAVERDGRAPVDEVVRNPNESEVRELQSEIPEAAGRLLFVLERESGAASALPVLAPGLGGRDAQTVLVDQGWARRKFAPADFYQVADRISAKITLLLSSTVRLTARSAYSWKKTPLWESALPSGLAILHAAEAVEGTRAFGTFSCGFFMDPGHRPEFDPVHLAFSGAPDSRPPLTYPDFRGNVELLRGFAPLRMETVGDNWEMFDILSRLHPEAAADGACWWTSWIDSDMTNYGFVVSRAFDDPTLLLTPRDPTRFAAAPWVAVPDLAAAPADRPLVAVFSKPAEAPHVALRSAWGFAGENLFESRLDYSLPSNLGFRVLHRLAALPGEAVGEITGYYSLPA